jgi:hypothetical protein
MGEELGADAEGESMCGKASGSVKGLMSLHGVGRPISRLSEVRGFTQAGR